MEYHELFSAVVGDYQFTICDWDITLTDNNEKGQILVSKQWKLDDNKNDKWKKAKYVIDKM